MKLNPMHLTDFYKTGHIRQYPPGTSLIYSNFTPRSSRLAKMLPEFDDKVVFFGLQGVIQWLLIDTFNREFFDKPKDEVVGRYKRRMDSSLGPGAVDTSHIEALHDLGYLPLHIKALPEGSRVNVKVPAFTVVNTLSEFYWLTNYVETMLSAECWKSMTTATIAYEYRRLLESFAEKTGSPEGFVLWQGHDFSMRGMSGVHDAVQTGSAHLLSFYGTDTIAAIDYLEDYYDGAKTFVGGSVPATEHSVMCMGQQEAEVETFRRLIEDTYPSGIISIVSDTWDFWRVLTEYAPALKDKIEARKPDTNGIAKVVFRPDSGDPVKIICGDVYIHDIAGATSLDDAKRWAEDILNAKISAETPHGECGDREATGYFRYDGVVYKAVADIGWGRHDKTYYYIDDISLESFETASLTPANKGAVECLWEKFGGTVNEKGFKILNQRVGLIYGDSITLERAQAILSGLEAKGFASCNVVFGIGSYTYQHITRDTFGHAMKATYGVVDGIGRDLFKDPVTDSGTKKSAKGRLSVDKVGDNFVLYDQQDRHGENLGELRTVFLNGDLHRFQTLEDIRRRLHG